MLNHSLPARDRDSDRAEARIQGGRVLVFEIVR